MMRKQIKDEKQFEKQTSLERSNREKCLKLFKNTPIYDNEILINLGLYMNRQSLSRLLFIHSLYKKIINVAGNITEFGTRWGQNMALFLNLRGIYEPYNYNRKIIGFDTFSGFPSVDKKDKNCKEGFYYVPQNYEFHLKDILQYHEIESPIPQIKKYEIIKGDATITFKEYLKNNPYTIVALAYFDFDIYRPTKECLNLLKDHVTKGSIIALDEINASDFPGETLALKEVFGLNNIELKRSPLMPLAAYFTVQ